MNRRLDAVASHPLIPSSSSSQYTPLSFTLSIHSPLPPAIKLLFYLFSLSLSLLWKKRNNSIRRQMNLSNPDFNVAQFQRQESLTGMSLGRLKPELYKQRSLEGDESRGSRGMGCGRLHFILKFDCDLEQLIVKIHRAEDLPAKDFSGTSDPYVKIYLLPDRKTKHQTKVHRKTLNPIFDEVFLFPVAYADLPTRKLHFSVYDFDRFSRHDIIGQVVVDNFLDLADFPRETKLCKEIQYVSSVSTNPQALNIRIRINALV